MFLVSVIRLEVEPHIDAAKVTLGAGGGVRMAVDVRELCGQQVERAMRWVGQQSAAARFGAERRRVRVEFGFAELALPPHGEEGGLGECQAERRGGQRRGGQGREVGGQRSESRPRNVM